MRGVFVAAQRLADRAKVAVLEKAQQNRGPVGGSQLVNGLVEDGPKMGQIGFGVIVERFHFGSLSFASLTTAVERA